jgi:hypothetical protein
MKQEPDPLNTPIDIDGYKGVIIWKYTPEGTYIEGEPVPPHWTCGWKVTVNGNQYGDWILIREPSDKVNDNTKEEAESVLLEQARESIKRVLAEAKC